MKKQIITSLTKKETQGKKELEELMIGIDDSILNLGKYLNDMILNLHKINQKQLYFYDKCSNLKEFVLKNKYNTKLNLTMAYIYQKIRIIEYCEKTKLPKNKMFEIGMEKLAVMQSQNIEEKSEIIKLSKMKVRDLKEKLHPKKDDSTGRFLGEDKNAFRRRPSTAMKNIMLEIPHKNEEAFEADFVQLCVKHNIRTP